MCSVRQRPMPSAPNSRDFTASVAGVGVGADLEPALLVGPAQDGVELLADLRVDQGDVVERHDTARALDRDLVPGPELDLADPDDAGRLVDRQGRGPGDAGPPHPAGDQRGVRGLAALGGEDAAGRVEAGDVVGLGEGANEDHVLAVARARRIASAALSAILPLGGAGRGRDPAGQQLVGELGVEHRMEQRLQRAGVDRSQRALHVEQPLLHGVAGEPHRRLSRALGVARLQQVEAALLDRELDVLHVAGSGARAGAGSRAARRGPRASASPAPRGPRGCGSRRRRPRPGRRAGSRPRGSARRCARRG